MAGDLKRCAASAAGFGRNDNAHVTIESIEKPHEPLHGEPSQLPCEQVGDLGLRRSKEARSLGLSQMSMGGDAGDLMRQSCFGNEFI